MSFKIYGSITRDLYKIWRERAEARHNRLRAPVIPMAFHDMKLFPSRSQVYEMLHCASECSHRPKAEYFTFGEFCIFASELRTNYVNCVSRPPPLSKMPIKAGSQTRRPTRRTNNPPALKYDVFLGGSCNPTTWRQDIAIPMLKSLGITYYNPQVTYWGPELIELENKAKEAADVLFFVIDNQTRSISSIIEAAYISGCRRKLILVIKPYEGPGQLLLGESISEREYLDLSCGQTILHDLVEKQGIPVFENIGVALSCTTRILREGLHVQDLNLDDYVYPVKYAHVQLGDKLIKLRETFDSLDTDNSGELVLRDVCMAFKILANHDLALEDLKAIINLHKKTTIDNVMDIAWDDIKINFDQFCCIFAEFKDEKLENKGVLQIIRSYLMNLLRFLTAPLYWLLERFLPRQIVADFNLRPASNMVSSDGLTSCKDVYLGGSCGATSWRQDVAIPLFKKTGLTYYNPQTSHWSSRLIPIEVAAMDNCSLLLFVITSTSRSLASMALAAHYVGLGCNVVICIQYLTEDSVIAGEKLSQQAIKDYNRGRTYLSDLSNQAGIPVFDDIAEAARLLEGRCICVGNGGRSEGTSPTKRNSERGMESTTTLIATGFG